MTHMKFATLSTSFYMERKTNTGLPAGDNCDREVSNYYVIGQNFVTGALTYIFICNLFWFSDYVCSVRKIICSVTVTYVTETYYIRNAVWKQLGKAGKYNVWHINH